ncbi:hypothetical protein G352_10272 [Rhodococcus ruber BKS 20-38]|uniref:Uncharacterized protein n=1 Tax=Rhodococcus ruber BKS 20-38 TaxID=1278076 RepID=M2ZYF4_9NOCA|nr:hypothetical protein [Rhodococcus ruber]EME65364.1 hypothetical protein G352_10272 [Rhodococcus ruber BKS 20-38]
MPDFGPNPYLCEIQAAIDAYKADADTWPDLEAVVIDAYEEAGDVLAEQGHLTIEAAVLMTAAFVGFAYVA